MWTSRSYPCGVDVLSDVLAVAQVDSALMATFDARAPWGISLPPRSGAYLHAVVAGTCWFAADLPGGPSSPRHLTPGDLVLLPAGTPHELSSEAPSPARPALRPFTEDLKRSLISPDGELVIEGPGTRARILCAAYSYRSQVHPVLGLLPAVLQVATAQPDAGPWLRAVVDLLAHEARGSTTAGSDTAAVRLLDILLVHVVRAWLDGRAGVTGDPADGGTGPVAASWLAGLRDPLTARTLAVMHEHPGDPWTLDTLAATVHTSRATLARRFTSQVGEPPLTYLARWRMELAAARLRATTFPVATIAREVGYTSEYAFNRAFTRIQGSPPGRYRRSSRSLTGEGVGSAVTQ
jgi:AraC-like DNA-binding protein